MNLYGVLAIIRDPEGRTLLQHRDDNPDIVWPDCWTILGGGVEPGESDQEAITREVEEEAGFTLSNPRFITTVVDHEGSGQQLTVFDADIPENTEPVLGEGQELRFVSNVELTQLKMPPYIRELLKNIENAGNS